jgi:hypothetical protein
MGGPPNRSGRYGEEKIITSNGTQTPTPRLSSPLPVAIELLHKKYFNAILETFPSI